MTVGAITGPAFVKADDRRSPSPRPFDRWSALLGALVITPLAVGAVRVWTTFDSYLATSDNAQNELVIRDIFDRLVLLGPFSREGWSHPGPALYYLMALPYRVLGSDSSAVLVGALMINAAAIVTMVLLARRWGGLPLALPVGLGLALLTVTLPNGFLHDPWNPFVVVLPFGAFVTLVWASMNGDRWAFPAACGIGTFCMQTHIGYSIPVVLLLAGAAWRIWRDRHLERVHGSGHRGILAFMVGAVVLGVLWLPPIVDQLLHDPGNLGESFRYFTHPVDRVRGFVDAGRVIGGQFAINADWLSGLRPVNPFSAEPVALSETPIPMLAVPFVAALVVAFRSRDRTLRNLGVTLLMTLGAGWLALARTIGPMTEYRLRWVWVVAMLCLAFSVAVAIDWASARRAASRYRATAVVASTLLIGAVAVVGAVRALDAPAPFAEDSRNHAQLTAQVLAHLRPGREPVLLRSSTFETAAAVRAITLALDHEGIPVRVPFSVGDRLGLGSERTSRDGPVRTVLVVVEDGAIEAVARDPDAHEIAYVGTVGRAEHRRVERRLEHLGRRGIDRFTAEAQRLQRQRQAIAVFEVPPFPGQRSP